MRVGIVVGASWILLSCMGQVDDSLPPIPHPVAEQSPPLNQPTGQTATVGQGDGPLFQAYTELLDGGKIEFRMVPIEGGATSIGCPDSEQGALSCESPRHAVTLDPFWMGACEVTWNEYRLFQFRQENDVDGITGPTPPYMPMDFGMGFEDNPAICMTQYAARQYCRWLSEQTGHFYRLPTEAEWEHACRAGTTTTWSFGDDESELDDYAWFKANGARKYHPVGQLKPNPWGLFDIHGNVAEWTLDKFDVDTWATRAASGEVVSNPIVWPKKEWGRVVRGGSYRNQADMTRSSSRRASQRSWKMQDPQMPKSIWYLTDAKDVGIRLVRPLIAPTPEKQKKYWEAGVRKIQRIHDGQMQGER